VMKTWQKALGAIGASVGAFLLGAKSIESRLAPEPKNVSLNDVSVDIQTYSLNEEGFLGQTAESILNQPLFQRFRENITLTLVDSHSTDGTREVAEKYYDRIWLAERGKLNARDYGTRRTDADIIVSTDADAEYPKGWLSNLLAPFLSSEVVATHGPKLSKRGSFFWEPFRAWWSGYLHEMSGIMSAGNSAYRRRAYFECGGFDLSVDQMERGGELNEEEEHEFRRKLEEVGEVVYLSENAIRVSERAMPFTLADGRVEKYKKEREKGIRF